MPTNQTKPTATHPQGRVQGRGRRFDHDAAFHTYAALGAPRSYRRVAALFAVSEAAIRQTANKERWAARIADLEAKANQRSERHIIRSFEERNARSIELVEKARDTALDGDLDPNVALRVFPRLATLEQLLAGEATSRIAVADLAPVLEAYNTVVLELAELARRVDAAGAERQLARLDSELALIAAQTAVVAVA